MKIWMIILSVLCALSFIYTFCLERELVNGELVMRQLRIIKSGSIYKIDELEGLGRNKHFLSFKEDE